MKFGKITLKLDTRLKIILFFKFSGFGHSTISGIHVFNFQAINNKVKGLGSKVGTMPTTKTGGTVE